jgi:RHS repeat-associated protein
MNLFLTCRSALAAACLILAASAHAQIIPKPDEPGMWYYPSSIAGDGEQCRIPEVYGADPESVALQVQRNNNAVTTEQCFQTCNNPYDHLRTDIINPNLAKAYLRSRCTGAEYSYDIVRKSSPKQRSCPNVPGAGASKGGAAGGAQQGGGIAGQGGTGTAGNPCDLATGYKVQFFTDYRDPDGDLELTRFYTSGPTSATEQPLGPKWQLSYLRRATGYNRPVPASDVQAMQVFFWRPQGNLIIFTYSPASASWSSSADVSERLTQRIGANGVHDGWILQTSGAASREIYDSAGRLIRLEDARGAYAWLTYSAGAGGQLSTVTNRKGRSISFTFDSKLLKKATLPDGGEVTYNYISGMLGWVTYPDATPNVTTDNPWTKYLYEKAGQPELLTGIIDENGNRSSSWGYDSDNKVNLSVHGDAASTVDRVSISYAADGSATVTSPLGAVSTTSFTTKNGIRLMSGQSAPCPGCNGAQFKQRSLDANGYSDVVTDFRDSQTDYDFAANGLLLQRVDAKNDATGAKRTTQTDWNDTLRVPLQRRRYDAAGVLLLTSGWSYNTRGQATVESQSDGTSTRSTTTAYCEDEDVTSGRCALIGQVLSVDGPRTDVADTTQYHYYLSDDASCAAAPAACPHRKGDLWKITDALGRATEILRYDGAGRPLSVRDANGVVTDYEYHPRGWTVAIKVRGSNDSVETDDRITRMEYWPIGTVRKVVLPDGSFTSYVYDTAKRLTDIVDMDGNSIHYTLDDSGNRTREDTKTTSGTLKRTLSRVYNALGQLQALKDASANATTLRYDANGNQERSTDALGRITDQGYDALNRVTRTLQDVGGLNVETKFEYDAFDRLTKVIDPKGLNTVYAYNGFGDQTRLTSPDTGITNYTYNASGEVATKQDANDPEPHRYTYDALGRPKTVSYTATGPADVSYDYDTVNSICAAGETFAVGRVTAMRVDGTELKYCYDRFGQVVRKAQVTDGSALILRYSYSLGGHLKTMIYPDGLLIDYVRDSQARIKEIGISPFGGSRSVLLNEVAYEPFGPVAGWAYGNGRVLTRAYDQDYRIKRIFDSLPGGLSVYYEYNSVGELIGLKDGLQSAQLARYDYDSLGRLTVTRDGPTGAPLDTYQYDPSGDRVGLTRGGVTQIYGYSPTSHWLTDVAGSARGYDAAGNVVSMSSSGKDFVYDANGRLSAIKTAGVVEASYRYNSLGERVLTAPTAAGTDGRRYLYDNAHWIGSYGVGGGASQQTIWLGDFPVGVLASNGNVQKLSYIQPDHLGAPRAVIDAARDARIWSWDMKGEVFGATIPDQDPDADGVPTVFDLRYAGQIYDVSSGSYYNYYRDYDPHTGRYLQSDPLGLFGGPNTYLYVGGSPLSYVDPLGLFGFGVLGGGSVEAGVPGLSAGATASVGGGVFIRNWNDAPLGGFAGGGVLSKGPTAQTQWTRPGGTSLVNASGVVGAFAGLGGGAYITNADCPEDLGGVAKTSTFNLGIGAYKFSIQLGLGYVGFKPVWIGSMTVGPGLGLSLSEYPTNTVTTSEIR